MIRKKISASPTSQGRECRGVTHGHSVDAESHGPVRAVEIHAVDAEKRAGHALFEEIDWKAVVGNRTEASAGDWVRILHAVLRRKARSEVTGDEVSPVSTTDLKREVDRFMQTHNRIPASDGGNYV